MREGLDRARGILPPEALEDHEFDADAVGFAAAFSEDEEFDEIPDSAMMELRRRPSRVLTSFRSQAARGARGRRACGSSGRATSS